MLTNFEIKSEPDNVKVSEGVKKSKKSSSQKLKKLEKRMRKCKKRLKKCEKMGKTQQEIAFLLQQMTILMQKMDTRISDMPRGSLPEGKALIPGWCYVVEDGEKHASNS